jgi:hypothetical protein
MAADGGGLNQIFLNESTIEGSQMVRLVIPFVHAAPA